jgi:hypothetical protein
VFFDISVDDDVTLCDLQDLGNYCEELTNTVRDTMEDKARMLYPGNEPPPWKGEEMVRLIQEGDEVFVQQVDEDGSISTYGPCTVLHTPSDVGDLWYITGWKGRVEAINPSCSAFFGFIKREGEKEWM